MILFIHKASSIQEYRVSLSKCIEMCHLPIVLFSFLLLYLYMSFSSLITAFTVQYGANLKQEKSNGHFICLKKGMRFLILISQWFFFRWRDNDNDEPTSCQIMGVYHFINHFSGRGHFRFLNRRFLINTLSLSYECRTNWDIMENK